MSPRVALTAALLLPLAGCATLGTNVSGSFACSAPDGICAPSSVIDDRALALIAGEGRDGAPATPAASPALLRSRALAPGQVAQPSQKVLRIVFPAHVDGQGRYHEPSVVRAVVGGGTWLAAADLAASSAGGLSRTAAASPSVPTPTSTAALGSGPPSAEAVRGARARAAAAPAVSREGIAAEVKAVLAKPAANAPAGFPAKVED